MNDVNRWPPCSTAGVAEKRWWIVAASLLLLAGCSSRFSGSEIFSADRALTDFENPLRKSTRSNQPKAAAAAFPAELAKGRNLEKACKYEEARTVYQRLIASFPQRYEGYHRLGVVADHQRRHREAQALYSQAICRCSGDPELFNDLGYCFFLQGKLHKAESALLKAVALCPSVARYRNNLGLVLGNLGRDEEALEQFRHGGSEADARYNLAFIWASREETDRAKECFCLALAADPTHERARRALTAFERYEQDPDALADLLPTLDSGIRWEPYVEADEAGPEETVEPMALAAADSDGSAGRSARPSTQSLLKRAQSLMSQRTAQHRGDP
ncbi:MAG: tetratricopeptide repeat protein [Pirellulales bacterium]|nr:tetratricopeptide repeat protein [Pirellulales bacterium]